MSEWISVEDRLPSNENEVLIHPPIEFRSWVFVGYYDPWKRKAFIVDDAEGDDFTYESVTHWMPYPEPPEESS